MTHRPRDEQRSVDVVVVGAGHAGCEAGLAAARTGCRALVVTSNLDRVGFMPCNPSIGGPGKSQLVAEIDALGGAMAEVTDAAALQLRMLNTSKGPAVRSLRAQVDKTLYSLLMKERLEAQPGLTLLQDEAVGIEVRAGRVVAIRLRSAGVVACGAVVVTAGTFLRAVMVSGDVRHEGGRAGDAPDAAISSTLAELGLATRRFKTGTPPRVEARSVRLDPSDVQLGDDVERWFSDAGERGRVVPVALPPSSGVDLGASERGGRTQLACYRLATNDRTHAVIRDNLHRAPMFNGAIQGVGPRYCPSIEDKVARFGDKPSHPIFLEPEGWRSGELYVQGMSTSLPPEVQQEALRSIRGLEEAVITRFGYAVEYEAVAPGVLSRTLEARTVVGLFFAGQVNGTSGYEEAAAQGVIAGANAAARVIGRPALELRRDQAYTGVMIDDLTSLPLTEPYRMLTARAEFRLSLRSSTAHDRLSSTAAERGLVTADRLEERLSDLAALDEAVDALEAVRLTPGSVHDGLLAAFGEPPVSKPTTARDLGRRPGMTLARLRGVLEAGGMNGRWRVESRLHHRLEERLQFDGFLAREAREAHRLGSIGMRPLMISDYTNVPGLRVEAKEQLTASPPSTFGDAQRLPGVTSADIAALLVHARRVGTGA